MSEDIKKFELFEGKTLSNLFEDIYKNSEKNRTQLDTLISKIAELISSPESASAVVPLIKEYFEVSVKNDEHLIKLAAVIQKILSADAKGGSDYEFGLSEEDKRKLQEQVMKEVDEITVDVQKHSDETRSIVDKADGIMDS